MAESTCLSPFEIVYGEQAKFPIDFIVGTQGKMPDATQFRSAHLASRLGCQKPAKKRTGLPETLLWQAS